MAHFPFHKAAIEPAVYDLGLQQSHSKKELELESELETESGLELGVGSCWWSCLLAAASVLGLAWPLDFLEIVRQTSERQHQPSAV